MDLVQHKKTGFWFPDGSGSQNAIREAYYLKDYGGLPSQAQFKDAVVMDCGAHIGTFARRALEEGAKNVVCYEPFPFSAECARKNLPEKAEIIEAAVVGDDAPETLDFYYRPQRLEGATLVHKGANHTRWNFQTISVNTINFWDELDRIKPSILKMDIEGAEWDVLDRELPDYVKALFIEVHQLYSKGAQAGLDFIAKAYPGSTEIAHTELIPFKNKGNVTNVSGLFVR